MSQVTPQPTEYTTAFLKEAVVYKSVCMFCKDYPCLKNDGNDTVSMVKCEKCNMWLHCHCIGMSSDKFSNDVRFYCCQPVHPDNDQM